MPIFQQGALNTTALVVPDLYVQIVAPQNLVLNGVPTNVVGMVGTATWGPVGIPVIVATMADYAQYFGPVVARKFDMGTAVACAVQQGATSFRCLRVSDGNDVAASYEIDETGANYSAKLTARYTGSLGNSLTVTITAAPQIGCWRLSVAMPGLVPEVFDNIPAPSAAAFWANLVSSVNQGNGPLRGPSQLVVATLGSAAATPAAMLPQSLAGGTDGATTVSTATLVGSDALPRLGMYALRGQACSVAMLADADDPTQWTAQAGFGLSEGIYMILVGPHGQAIADAVSAKQAAGLDSYATKLIFGDWVFWNDQANGLTRLVSPQGFVAGRLGNLSPEQSSLNKPLYNVVGTEKPGVPGSGQTSTYSDAELTVLFESGIDVVSNPQPGGAFWGVRCGHNTSSNPAINGDNYTRLTNYIAATLAAGMGQYVGQVINASLFQQIRATQLSYLQALLSQGVLGSVDGSVPFNVICDLTNNPLSRTSLGYVQSDAQVQFMSINEKFIVNVEGGQTVIVQRQVLPAS